MELIRRIFKKSIIILVPLAVLSAVIEWKKLPVSILAGGVLGFANIKGLAWGVEGLFGADKATGKMIFFSMFRLFMLFLILLTLVYLKLVNIFGILIGFTVIFALLIIEGYRFSKDRPTGGLQ
jgi:hypothetical protein